MRGALDGGVGRLGRAGGYGEGTQVERDAVIAGSGKGAGLSSLMGISYGQARRSQSGLLHWSLIEMLHTRQPGPFWMIIITPRYCRLGVRLSQYLLPKYHASVSMRVCLCVFVFVF